MKFTIGRFLLWFGLFVLAMLFVFSERSQAQDLDRVVSGNLGIITRNHVRGDIANTRARIHNIIFHDRYGYGYFDDGYFFGTDQYGRGYRGRVRLPYGYGGNAPGFTTCDFTECRGIVGTFHAHKGRLHFRPYDPTDQRVVGVLGGGALGSGAGAVIGKIADGNRGAAIGGIAGAVAGGLISNARQHNNCLVIKN